MAQARPDTPASFHAVLEQANIQPLWDRYHDLLPEQPCAPGSIFRARRPRAERGRTQFNG